MSRDKDDTWFRGEVLAHLRHGIRQSSRLAEQLSADTIVGNEASGLLCRLNAIRAELERLSFSVVDQRRAHNDPFWDQPPHPFRQAEPNHSAM